MPALTNGSVGKNNLILPRETVIFDEKEELERIKKEHASGKTELVGCLFLNEPEAIIGVCKDQFDEILYLVTYKSTKDEVYSPTWC